MPVEKLTGYVKEIQLIKKRYREKLQVYLGLEVDFIPGVAGRYSDILKNTDLDYFIGSIHYIDKFPGGEYWNIDTTQELFEKGLKEIFHNDIRKAVVTFWENTRNMVETDRPDIIGHMDKIKMFSKNNNLFNENEKWYREQVELTLQTIKKHNTIVEINTRGYYKFGKDYLYPGEEIITLLTKYQIPVTISSDAHIPAEITKGLSFAAGKLINSGITHIAALQNGRWEDFPLTHEGISIN